MKGTRNQKFVVYSIRSFTMPLQSWNANSLADSLVDQFLRGNDGLLIDDGFDFLMSRAEPFVSKEIKE